MVTIDQIYFIFDLYENARQFVVYLNFPLWISILQVAMGN